MTGDPPPLPGTAGEQCATGDASPALAAILDALPGALLVQDAHSGQVTYANPAMARLLGWSIRDLIGRGGAAFRAEFAGHPVLDRSAQDPSSSSGIVATVVAGEPVVLHVRHLSVTAADGAPSTIVVADDMTNWAATQDELTWRAERDLLTGLLNRDAFVHTLATWIAQRRPFALLSIDLDRFKGINDALGHVAGDAALAQLASRLDALMASGDAAGRLGGDEFALALAGPLDEATVHDRATRVAAALAAPLRGEVAGVVVNASIGIAMYPDDGADVDDLRRRADVALYAAKRAGGGRPCRYRAGLDDGPAWPAERDATSLHRRLGGGAADRAAADDHRTFVAIAEIDRFGALRRRIGYAVATGLVGGMADRVRQAMPAARVGRVGRTSVEFAFAARSLEEARAQLTALSTALEQPLLVDGYAFELTAAIGVVDATGHEIDDRQLDGAAAALAAAQDRRTRFVIAGADPQDGVGISQLSIMRDLRDAMSRDELKLHYQPKLRCRTDTIDSAEALLRWFHPEFGLVRTDKLVEMAEATGAIRDLTFWTIDRAIADRARLAAAGRPLTLYVNISGQLLADRVFAQWALERLAGNGGSIGFEITETAIIDEPEIAIDHLQRFAAAGIKIAIDDYGSGLSSLAYLKQLPAHELKIDQMFVSGLTDSHRDPLLVRSSIDLAHALEMEVTAEGVDDPISLSLLRVMGCDLVQGYLISPPVPIDALEAFLRDDGHRQKIGAAAPALHGWSVAEIVATGQP